MEMEVDLLTIVNEQAQWSSTGRRQVVTFTLREHLSGDSVEAGRTSVR